MVFIQKYKFYGCSNYHQNKCAFKIQIDLKDISDIKQRKEDLKITNTEETPRTTTRISFFVSPCKVVCAKWVDITFPDIKGIWKIKILPRHYEIRPRFTSGGSFGKRLGTSTELARRTPDENSDDIIAMDTPLARAILGLHEGDIYSYIDRNGDVITGRIIKIYG